MGILPMGTKLYKSDDTYFCGVKELKYAQNLSVNSMEQVDLTGTGTLIVKLIPMSRGCD